MKILFFGDVFGRWGRKGLGQALPELKERFKPDLVMANVENLAHGRGITKKTLDEITEYGVEAFTSGNHIFERRDTWVILDDKNLNLVRPANYPPGVPGRGSMKIRVRTAELLVVNLIGRVFFKPDFDCPFREIDKILEENRGVKNIFVDFHSEATSEIKAMKWYLNGRVSALVGTHTHVQTGDEEITSEGLGYLSDVGMVGPVESILGMKKEGIIKSFVTQVSGKEGVAEGGAVEMGFIFLEIDVKTGRAIRLERHLEKVDID